MPAARSRRAVARKLLYSSWLVSFGGGEITSTQARETVRSLQRRLVPREVFARVARILFPLALLNTEAAKHRRGFPRRVPGSWRLDPSERRCEMRRFLRTMVVSTLFVLTCSTVFLSGPVCMATAATVSGGHSTGEFCDSSLNHGTSGSCKRAASNQGRLTCPAGTSASSINCSLPGNSCDSGNGSVCTCTYSCSGPAN